MEPEEKNWFRTNESYVQRSKDEGIAINTTDIEITAGDARVMVGVLDAWVPMTGEYWKFGHILNQPLPGDMNVNPMQMCPSPWVITRRILADDSYLSRLPLFPDEGLAGLAAGGGHGVYWDAQILKYSR